MSDETTVRFQWLAGSVQIDWNKLPFQVVVNGHQMDTVKELEAYAAALNRKRNM